MTKAVRVEVFGRVQGVGFRAWCAEEARGRRLSGWVRNRSGGTVEAVFGGDAIMVDAMVDRIRQGPTAARVERITVEDTAETLPARFEVRGTG